MQPIRADEVFSAGSVLQDIVSRLMNSSVVLADITEENRNVHYELGLAHALGKPTVLIAPQGAQLFFDVGQERMITYSKDNAFWGADLATSISRTLRTTMENPASAIPTAFMHIKPVRLEQDEVVLRLRRIEEVVFDILRHTGGGMLVGSFSRLKAIVKSLPVAELEAAELLKSLNSEEAITHLVSSGYGRVMAEAAVATAGRRL